MSPRLMVRMLATVVTLACRPRAPCEPGPPQPPQLRLVATADANGRGPDDAAPTELRIYQLRSRDALAAADYDAIRRSARQVLGADLVREHTGVLYPGESVEVDVQLHAETRFLAAIAFVREPVGTSWRAVAPLPTAAPGQCPAPRPSGYEVRLRKMKVTLVARRGSRPGPTPASDEPASLDIADPWNDETAPKRRRTRAAPRWRLHGSGPAVTAPASPGVTAPGVTVPTSPGVTAPASPGVTTPTAPNLTPPASPALEIKATPWR